MSVITHSNLKIGITGTSSGLGRVLLGAIPDAKAICRPYTGIHTRYDVIVHCAFDSTPYSCNDEQYTDSNWIATANLLKLRPLLFIFISSIAVHGEEDTDYKLFKKLSESRVRRDRCVHAILRPGLILGSDDRPNSITKILEASSNQLTLSEKSTFNCVNVDDIAMIVTQIINNPKEYAGEYDIVSTTNVSLSEVSSIYDTKNNVKFGEYVYCTPRVQDNTIIASFPVLDKTSEQVIAEYYNKRHRKK